MALPNVNLTIDSRSVPMEDDWQSTEVVSGGMERFSARVPLDRIRRLSIGQESQAILWGDDIDTPIWWGTLSQDPHVEGEVASIDAEGPAAHMEKDAKRLLYLSRDVSAMSPVDQPPLSQSGAIPHIIQLSPQPGALPFVIEGGTAIAVDTFHGAMFWAPGTPGGITSVAWNDKASFADGNWKVEAWTGTGPGLTGGTNRVQANVAVGPTARSASWSASHDQIALYVARRNSGTTPGAAWLLFYDLRFRGIATADTMTALAVMQDVFGRMGWSTSGLVGSGTDVMPLDWHGGTFRELAVYVASLVETPFIGPLRPDGTGGRFEPWGHTEWRMQKARGARFDLGKLKVYNKVVVPYSDVGGATREVSATASPDPLASKGVTRTFMHGGLSDVQANADLATAIALNYAARLSTDRWVGTISAVEMKDAHGRDRTYYSRPGDHAVEQDAGPNESRTHRVHALTKSKDGAQITVEDDALVSGLEGLAALKAAASMGAPELPMPASAPDTGREDWLRQRWLKRRQRWLKRQRKKK